MSNRQKKRAKRVERKECAKKASLRPFTSLLNRRLIGFGVTGALIFGLCAKPAFIFGDNTLNPEWGNPQTPHNTEGQSGVINLGAGGTYSKGYNGTSLRYYFNDDAWVLAKQKAILEENVVKATANSASAVAAEAVAIADLLPAPIALGGVAVAMAAFDLLIANEDLALFNSYTIKTVNTIDYNGSLTVNGYGTLGGTYQNIETMTLTTTGGEGEVKLDDGALDTIQSLKSAQDFVITSTGEVYNVETAKFDKNFTNEGTAVYVGAIKVDGSMQNEGKLAYVGPIETNSLVNTKDGEMLDVEAINVKSMSNLGEIIVDDLKFNALENSGSLSVLCQTSGEMMTITGDFSSAGSVDVDVIETSSDGSFLTKGSLTAGAFTSKGTTIVQGPAEITRKLRIESGSWTSVGDVSARNIDINGSFTALGSVETVDPLIVRDSGKAYFGGPLSAAQIKNDGEIQLEGSAIVDSLVDLGENGKIIGTSPNSSLKAGDMTGGSVSGLHSLDVNGYVWDVDVDMGGAGSSANVGRFVGSTSVSNVGTLVVREQSATTGAISGAGVGSTFTFLDASTVGDISNFGSLSVAKSLTATSVDGAGVDATASIGGDLSVSGDVQNIDKLVVGGNATIDKLFGTGEGSVYKIGGNLGGFSSIDSVETLVVGGTTEVAADAEILGTGAGSKFKTETLGGADGAMAGRVENFERLDVAKDLTNKGEIIGTGAGSHFVAQGDITNQGEISNYEYLEAGAIKNEEGAKLSGTEEGSILKADSITNSGEIAGVETAKVAGAVENTQSGTITGSGTGSTFKADSMTNSGAVAGLENIGITGAVENAQGGSITGTGAGSTLTAGSVTNSGAVANVENIGVAGAVENAQGGSITGTGAGSTLKADSVTNSGAVAGVENIGVAGAVENAQGGTITGTGVGSVLTADSVTNNGSVANVESIGVAGAVENAQGATITGTGAGSALTADSVTNSGAVAGVEKIGVTGAVENAQGATITGTGAGSALTASSVTNNGDVADVESIGVAGALENAAGATITGTGAGSSLTADSATNGGTIDGVERIGVAGALENAQGGTIAGTGAGSVLTADSVTNSGAVAGVENIGVAGAVENAQGGTITGTGAGSTLKADSVTNSGDVSGVETVEATGAVENAQGATITGTGAGSAIKADSVTNSGDVSGVETVEAAGAVENAAGASITGTGAGSTIKADSVTNSGDVSGVGTVEAAGAVENAAGASITGTGAGSSIKADSVTNSGDVSGVETVEAAGAVENAAGASITGTGAGSTIKADSLTNNGDITNVEGFDVAGTTENAAGATISGSGAGANAAVSGDMTNAGTYGGFDKTSVEGNLTNTGELEVGEKTSVGGDFTNDGGTLKTELYGNTIGSVAVEGSATVNGGTLAIDATGEKMQIGQYYYAIATDGGLTVENELTIDEDGSAPTLFHVEGFYDENNYYVGLRRDHEHGSDPHSHNEASFVQYLDEVAYTLDADDPFYESSDVVKVLSALDEAWEADPDVGREMAQSMDGEVYADMGYATLMASIRAHERVADALRPNLYLVCEECGNLRHGAVCDYCGSESPAVLSVYPYPEEAAFGRRFWGVVFGSFGDVKNYDGARGFKTDAAGTAFGSDFYRNSATRLGVFGVYQYTALKGRGQYVRERGNIDAYQIGAYAYRENTFGAFLGSATVGLDKYKSGRVWNWNDDSLARTHRGKSKGAEFSLRMEEYANVRVGDTVWQPYVATSYAYATVDSFREKTTSGANPDGTYTTQLHNRDYDMTSWRSDLGLRGSYCWVGSNGKPIALRGRASWVHEFCDTNATIVGSFTGTRDGFVQTEYQPSNPNGLNDLRYSVSSVDMGRDYAWLGLGLVGDGIYDVISLFGGYDCLFNGRSATHNLHIGVDCEW